MWVKVCGGGGVCELVGRGGGVYKGGCEEVGMWVGVSDCGCVEGGGSVLILALLEVDEYGVMLICGASPPYTAPCNRLLTG